MTKKIYRDTEGAVVSVTTKDDKVTVRALAGFTDTKKLCVLKDTGNGFIIKFPAWNCVTQDYYVCLDYAQMANLELALKDLNQNEYEELDIENA
jgi:hypothetical protein